MRNNASIRSVGKGLDTSSTKTTTSGPKNTLTYYSWRAPIAEKTRAHRLAWARGSSCSSLSPTPSGSIAIPERRGNAVKNGDSDTGANVDKEHIAACKQGCKQESIFLEEKQSSDRNLGAALDRG